MSDEEQFSQDELEQDLWQEVRQREGADRAKAITALSRILWNRNKYKESLAFCESARDLYLEAGRENYLDELTDVNFGIMNNLDMLNRSREAAEAAAAPAPEEAPAEAVAFIVAVPIPQGVTDCEVLVIVGVIAHTGVESVRYNTEPAQYIAAR